MRFPTNRYHLFTVELALNEVLCICPGSEGSIVGVDGCTMLMSPNDGETAVRGCHSLGDMVVHMHAELGGDNPVWQTGQPTSVGHQTYHVNVIKLK